MSVAQSVDDVILMCAGKFRVLGVQLERSAIPAEWSVLCRPSEFSQVLVNLLSNAHDAVQDSPEQWVRISAHLEDRFVHFRVEDSGSGIPLETRARIFEPFFTTKPPGRGTGLGLSVSRRLVEQSNGKLWLDPELGRTCFHMKLPKE